MKKATLQQLDLTVGERAKCSAGYPTKGTIIIECIKDFDTAPNSDDIINNPYTYITLVDTGRFGALTSHFISSAWTDEVWINDAKCPESENK